MTDEPDFSAFEGYQEMGKMGLSIYRAVVRDGGTNFEALQVTAAFFAGMIKGSAEENNSES